MKSQKFWISHRLDNNLTDKLTTVLLVIYLMALVWILLFKLGVQFSYMGNSNVNLIPFQELFIAGGKIDLAELIMNVVIFIPLGIYVGVLFKRWTFWIKLFFCFVLSVMFELLQFILKAGVFDMTDIINNSLGVLIGLITFKIIVRIFYNNDYVRSQNFINLIATIGTFIMIALLVLLKLNMLPLRYQ